VGDPSSAVESLEARVLEATKRCLERWGFAKLTIDDIAAESRVSRATIYRMFPGGKDVLFEAMRVRELEEFFDDLKREIVGVESLEEVLVQAVVTATQRLRDDEHLALMLAAEPGTVLNQLTAEGVPRIMRMATAFLVPFVEPYVGRAAGNALIDVLSRLTISYFLAPSDVVDLGDVESARGFLGPFIETLTEHPLHRGAVVRHASLDH
jgi:AcrR family transcriptional regulator